MTHCSSETDNDCLNAEDEDEDVVVAAATVDDGLTAVVMLMRLRLVGIDRFKVVVGVEKVEFLGSESPPIVRVVVGFDDVETDVDVPLGASHRKLAPTVPHTIPASQQEDPQVTGGALHPTAV
jgi:hypothetical protein